MKIAIFGYGNLGRGIESAAHQNPDVELVAVFTRRDPNSVSTNFDTPVESVDNLQNYKDKIDCLICCGGSATDLPKLTPQLAADFNVVDSFDTHANIPQHFENVNKSAKKNNHIALISAGWDPGLFSLNRVYAKSILPNGADYTFWGKGVSQGHSDAIRRIPGVIDARQYTVPVENAVDEARSGTQPELSTRQKHTRECFVVVEDSADKKAIENKIKNMPNYFADYDTTVTFVSQEELDKNHKGLPHGGFVICSGKTGKNLENNQVIEYNLKLDSNPEFTASAIIAFARGLMKMYDRGIRGCQTVFDIAPADMSPISKEDLIKHYL